MNQEGKPDIKATAERSIVALPNALKDYSGKRGGFMRHDMAKFVGEGMTIEDLR